MLNKKISITPPPWQQVTIYKVTLEHEYITKIILKVDGKEIANFAPKAVLHFRRGQMAEIRNVAPAPNYDLLYSELRSFNTTEILSEKSMSTTVLFNKIEEVMTARNMKQKFPEHIRSQLEN